MPYPDASIPLDYSTPPFPSLYWPIRPQPGAPQYLYHTTDIWRFTLYWTLITFCLVHSAVAAWAVLMQFHSAMTQRRLLRRQRRRASVSTPATGPAHVNLSASAPVRSATADGESVESAPSSRSRRSSTGLGEKSRVPQPLLMSESPVLSTLGWVWLIPVVYLFVGGIEALLSGSLVGIVVGAVYNAGYFKMSTWMPFFWGIINCLVVILGSFRIQGGL